MKAIATEFGLERQAAWTGWKPSRPSANFCSNRSKPGKETVLIIDEAQNLTEELLEQVRLLSNIETDDRKLLQIVLLGQPELRDRLNSPRLRQLRQRITVRYHLAPLTRSRLRQYIQHRLDLAGSQGMPTFHAAGVLADFQLQPRHPAPGQRGLRQGAAGRLCGAQLPHQLSDGGPRHPRTGRRHPPMSLINDALKRAQESQRSHPPSGALAIAAR